MKPTTPFHFLSIRDHLSTMVYCSSQTAQCVVEISVTLCSYRNVQCVTGTVLHCPAYNSYSVTLSTVQQLQYHCPVNSSYSITAQCTIATVSLSSEQQLQYHCPVHNSYSIALSSEHVLQFIQYHTVQFTKLQCTMIQCLVCITLSFILQHQTVQQLQLPENTATTVPCEYCTVATISHNPTNSRDTTDWIHTLQGLLNL